MVEKGYDNLLRPHKKEKKEMKRQGFFFQRKPKQKYTPTSSL